MIQDLGKRMEAKIEKMQEMIKKDLEELKNKQTEMNNTITEMKTALEGINSRITEAEERISDLEDRSFEITQSGENKFKRIFKRVKKIYVNYQISLTETIYELLESQKEKRGRKGQKAYLK